jgi:Mu transposase-like protein
MSVTAGAAGGCRLDRLRPDQDRRPPARPPGQTVPLHPEAVACAGHYDFAVDVLAAYRPTGKGRVERQVTIIRDHVLAGRAFSSLDELDAAFAAWVPQRRALRHRTHAEIIGVRAIGDHAVLRPVPAKPYVVADRHLRHVGKDCLVAYAGNLYSVPAVGRGARIVDETHWDGLPDGTPEPSPPANPSTLCRVSRRQPGVNSRGPLQDLLTRAPAAQVTVEARPLSVYDQIAQASPFTNRPHLKDVSRD